MRTAFVAILCISLYMSSAILLPNSTYASPLKTLDGREEVFEKRINLILTAARTKTELLVLLSQSANREAFLNIQNAITITDEKLPRISILKTAFLVDGKATGVTISSYQPFRLKRNGIVWNYDSSALLDVSFNSLWKFLSSRSISSKIEFVTGEKASADEIKDAKQSRYSFFTAGTLFALSGSILLAGGILAYGAGVYYGLAAAMTLVGLNQMHKAIKISEEREIWGSFLGSRPTFTCTPGLVNLHWRETSIQPQPSVLSVERTPQGTVFKDSSKREIAKGVFSDDQRKTLDALASSCQSDSDAKRLNESVQKAALMMKPSNVESPASATQRTTPAIK